MIDELYVFYRPIGSNDESATDEEQGEKMLYSYPPGKSLNDQLSRVMMLEGLIDFTCKFSDEDIDVVIMEDKTWAFLQCEPELWMVCCSSVDQRYSSGGSNSKTSGNASAGSSSSSTQIYRPSGTGLLDSLTKLYRMYVSFRGEIATFIADGDGPTGAGLGQTRIDRAQSLRKKVRKCIKKMRQEEYDLACVLDYQAEQEWNRQQAKGRREAKDRGEEVEEPEQSDTDTSPRLGLAGEQQRSQEELERGIEDIKTEIKGLEAQLSVEVETDTDTDTGKKKKKEKDVEGEESKEGEGSSFPAESASTLPALQEHSSQSQYTPSIVRRRLRSFIDWYISSGEMNYPSALHSASGMHYCAIGHPAFGGLTRVRQAVDDISKGLCSGCVLLYDGQVAWSDLDENATFMLYEFVRMQEHQALRADLLEYSKRIGTENATQANKKYKDTRDRDSRGARLSVGGSEDFDHERGPGADAWIQARRTRRGFVTKGWETADLDESIFRVEESGEGEGDGGEEGNGNDNGNGNGNVPLGATGATSVAGDTSDCEVWETCLGKQQIWCPRFFVTSSENSNSDSNSNSYSGGLSVSRELSLRGGRCEGVGRLLLYRQSCVTLALLVPDWDQEREDMAALYGSSAHLQALAALGGQMSAPRKTTRDGDSAISRDRAASATYVDLRSLAIAAEQQHADTEGDKWDKGDEKGKKGEGDIDLLKGTPSTPSAHQAPTHRPEQDTPGGSSKSHTRLRAEAEAHFMNLCAYLQRGLSAELEQLLSQLEHSRTPSSSSSSQTQTQGQGQDAYGYGYGYGDSLGSEEGLISSSANVAATEGVKVLYFNGCNRAVRQSGLSSLSPSGAGQDGNNNNNRGRKQESSRGSLKQNQNSMPLDQVFMWPSPLIQPPHVNVQERAISGSGGTNTNTNISTNTKSNPNPVDRFLQGMEEWENGLTHDKDSRPSTRKDLEGGTNSNSQGGHVSAQQLSLLASDYRARFPAPAAMLSCTMDQAILRAFNDLREHLSSRSRSRGTGGDDSVHDTEICLRLRTAQRGGRWVLGRRLGDRQLYLSVDGCATLNEMHSRAQNVTNTVFNRVLL